MAISNHANYLFTHRSCILHPFNHLQTSIYLARIHPHFTGSSRVLVHQQEKSGVTSNAFYWEQHYFCFFQNQSRSPLYLFFVVPPQKRMPLRSWLKLLSILLSILYCQTLLRKITTVAFVVDVKTVLVEIEN